VLGDARRIEPMTEAEWLACDDVRRMLDFAHARATPRKCLLFAVACCRRIEHLLIDERSRAFVAVLESWADGRATHAEYVQAHQGHDEAEATYCEDRTAWWAVFNANLASGPEGLLGCGSFRAVSAAGDASYAAGQALASGLTDEDAAAPLSRYGARAERAVQAHLLRDILGNPFHTPALDPAWLTHRGGNVPLLARAIYDERRFDELPVLADALEDASCADSELLSHCRARAEHVRGCWALDFLLGLNS
jgi:hypothetical protein